MRTATRMPFLYGVRPIGKRRPSAKIVARFEEPVAVLVFEALDLAAGFVAGADAAVRVAPHLADEDAALFVEAHCNRIDDARLAGHELNREPLRDFERGEFIRRGERIGAE